MEEFALTAEQRGSMHDIFQLTQSRRNHMEKIEDSMHEEFDQM